MEFNENIESKGETVESKRGKCEEWSLGLSPTPEMLFWNVSVSSRTENRRFCVSSRASRSRFISSFSTTAQHCMMFTQCTR